MDTSGIHEIGLDFCNCATAQPHFVQLLQHGWFPATVSSPKSAATFRVLKQFHLLSFESKASAFEFYCAIARETDNTGTKRRRVGVFLTPIWRYRCLTLVILAGSVSIISMYDQRISAHQDVEAIWEGPQSIWSFGNTSWRVCSFVPSLPPARNELARRVANCTRGD